MSSPESFLSRLLRWLQKPFKKSTTPKTEERTPEIWELEELGHGDVDQTSEQLRNRQFSNTIRSGRG